MPGQLYKQYILIFHQLWDRYRCVTVDDRVGKKVGFLKKTHFFDFGGSSYLPPRNLENGIFFPEYTRELIRARGDCLVLPSPEM